MRTCITLSVVAALAAGCNQLPQMKPEQTGIPPVLWKQVTPEERAAYDERERRQAAEEQQRRWNAMIGYYAPFCERLGFKADTDGWRNCIMQQLLADDQRRYEAATYASRNISRAISCQMVGRAFNCY